MCSLSNELDVNTYIQGAKQDWVDFEVSQYLGLDFYLTNSLIIF